MVFCCSSCFFWLESWFAMAAYCSCMGASEFSMSARLGAWEAWNCSAAGAEGWEPSWGPMPCGAWVQQSVSSINAASVDQHINCISASAASAHQQHQHQPIYIKSPWSREKGDPKHKKGTQRGPKSPKRSPRGP